MFIAHRQLLNEHLSLHTQQDLCSVDVYCSLSDTDQTFLNKIMHDKKKKKK